MYNIFKKKLKLMVFDTPAHISQVFTPALFAHAFVLLGQWLNA